MASEGGQRTDGANGGGYVITISREVGEIGDGERFHMPTFITESVTEALTSQSEHNPFNKLETAATRRETISKQKEVENRLGTTLEEIIIALATFFIYFISFLGSFQQPSHDHFRFIAVALLVGIIWIFTVFLVIIWWRKLNDIRVEIDTLVERARHLPKWHTCRGLIVFLGIVATLFSVYFACILYSQWLGSSSPAPAPSALQLPSSVLMDTQYYAVQ